MATQFGFAPDPTKVSPGDTILFGPNVTSQSESLLRLQTQGATSPELNEAGETIGARVTKPFVDNQTIQNVVNQESSFLPQRPLESPVGAGTSIVIQPQLNESNNTAAQRLGFANAAEARENGATFSLTESPSSVPAQRAPAPSSAFSERRVADSPSQGLPSDDVAPQDSTVSSVTDIFGNTVSREDLESQARSNLFTSLRIAGKTTAQINAEVDRILSNSSDEELNRFRKNLNLPTEFGEIPGSVIDAAGEIGIGQQDILDAFQTQTDDDGRTTQAVLDAQEAAIDRIEEMIKLQMESISADFGEAIQETRDTGGRIKGSLKRILGRAGGFTTSAGGQALAAQESSLQQQIGKLRKAEAAAKAKAAMELRSEIGTVTSDTQESLRNIQNDIRDAQNDRAQLLLDLMGEMRSQRKDAREASEVEAIDPFFSGSNIISLMKELEVGQTETITDPNTGTEFTISGLSQPTANTQLFRSVDQNTGNETFTTIDKNTGQIINQEISKGTGSTFKATGPVKAKLITLDQAIKLGDPSLAGKTYDALENVDIDELVLTPEVVELLMQGAIDEDDNFDANKLPGNLEDAVNIIGVALEKDLIDTEDEETQNWLSTQWQALRNRFNSN